MRLQRLLPLVFVAVAFLTAAAAAREGRQPDAASPGLFELIPKDAVTDHVLSTDAGPLPYTATAGTIDLYGQDGKVGARLFYTAYVAKDGKGRRPLTFAFNGGPGAASAYLHLGMAGPRVVALGPGRNDGTTPELSDNPDSWLAFTDLVFVDPVGAGWSRAAGSDVAARFYGVRQDAESLAKFIALYVQENDRLASPKYLLGESYGGFRAAKLAAALKSQQGILVSGVLMVSPMIDGRYLLSADADPLTAALVLPSLAAATLERAGRFSRERVAETEHFAMTDYLVALAGAPPSGPAAGAFYTRVAEATGLPVAAVAQSRGFVASLYAKQAAAGAVLSPYDAGHAAPDAYPEQTDARNDDPVLDGYTRAYGAAFAAYARNELGFRTGLTYTLLNGEANRRWDWGGRRAEAAASGDLHDLLSVTPSFRLAIFHGYSDILTPYGVSRYILDHLPQALAEGRVSLSLHRGGHMFYTDPVARREAADAARAFFAGAGAD
ncbi:S10 family peptidase [Ensifer soli]|uniref:S10 family peptidase n=1 Tax=Ciceribacter sp. sgz301302 TaxID=3342379 RepID=UPI0035BB1B1F